MNIIKDEIYNINLSKLIDNITRKDHKDLLLADAGKEHYKLLYYLSKQISNKTIVELGTHHGTSSMCLCNNISNKVYTFDIKNIYSCKISPPNLTRYIGNIFDLKLETLLLDAELIFLDTAHTGDFEKKIYTYLLDNAYTGFLLLDDIFFNEEMIMFWNSINLTKYDISYIGHGGAHPTKTGKCGTGIIDFNNKLKII